ncbi:MAG: sterol desaturase family protein [Sedimentitalea sp.]
MTDTSQDAPAGMSRAWHHHPKLPINMSPVFELPFRTKAAFDWMIGSWFRLTPPVNHMVFAIIALIFFWPTTVAMQTLGWGWALQIFAINLGASVVLGGGLHLYLYVFAGQDMRLRYDIRAMEQSARFTFGNQVWDNLFWSIASGIPIWSAWMVLYFWLAANNTVPTLPGIATAPVWFVLMFFLIRFWQSFHFYWIHRLIHIPVLFKHVHSLHHRNVNVGPWSGLSMHPLEHLFYFSSILIHFVLPSHPLHVVFHMFSLSLGALLSHAGYEKLLVKDRETLKAGSFHHQLHHRFFECNYGSEEIPLDRWFGSFHDGTDAATKRIRARKKLIFARR